jgi:hypothetical protein
VCLPCSQLLCDQLEEIIEQESQYNVDCTITLGECLICAKEMQQTKTLMIRDPTAGELGVIAKRTQANVRRREEEVMTGCKGEHIMESARGTEIKVNVQNNNQGVVMSAVKPMRLSFHQIIDPSTAGGESSSGGSPFKKRLTDLFSGGAKGFGFEDIFLSASPDKTRRGGGH